VVDFPPTYHELWLQASMCHGNPVAEGINRPIPALLRRKLESRPPAEGGRVLAQTGYRWAVFHHSMPGPAFSDVEAGLLPCKSRETSAWAIYDLHCAASSW